MRPSLCCGCLETQVGLAGALGPLVLPLKEQMALSCPREREGGPGAVRAFDLFSAGGYRASACQGLRGRCVLCPLQTISELKGKISELQWSVMNQEMQLKSLESEKQELQEQLELQLR